MACDPVSWGNGQAQGMRNCPDFLVEYSDGRRALIEVKDPSRIDSDDVKRKRKATEMWCKKGGVEYVIATIGS